MPHLISRIGTLTLVVFAVLLLSGCGKDEAANACADVTCERGVCDAATSECVNDESCTEETEQTACVDGYFCHEQECVTEAALCADLDCRRGVCDPSTKACVNDDTCANDLECLDDFFCAEDGDCAKNLCDPTEQDCARGVCDRATGTCVNDDTCSGPADCTDGFYCVGDACVAIEDACGVGGCPGNQVCSYDEAATSATCIENPDGCSSAADCVAPRTCDDGACAAPTECVPDTLEPNDALADTTDFLAEATDDVVTASLCAGDVDFYTYDTSATALITGTLSVDLRTRPVDIGVGTIVVRVVSEDGSYDTTVSGLDPAPVVIPVDGTLTGRFSIEVSSADITLSGAQYDLNVVFYEDATAQACMAPTPLTLDTPFNGSTAAPASTELGSKCTSLTNDSGEQIFSVDVPETSYLEAVVTPDSGVDVAVSIREECLSSATEIACASAASVSSAEIAGAVVPAGTYFVVVQGPDASATPGGFSIAATAIPTICLPGNSTCLSGSEGRACNPEGTGYDMFTCDSGCANGVCNPRPSDSCANALDLIAAGVFTGPIEDYANTYSPHASGCTASTAEGGDAAFDVTAQPGEVVTVELTAPFDAALSIVTNCFDLAGSCVIAAQESTASSVDFLVEPGVDYYAIVDSDPGDAGDFEIRATAQSQTCTPGTALSCSTGTELEYCSPLGIPKRYACDGTCTDGACDSPRATSCFDPIKVTNGYSVDDQVFDTPNNFDPGTGTFGSCDFTNLGATPGPDRVHEIELAAGETLVATMDSETVYATMYLLQTCGDFDSCVTRTGVGAGPVHEIQYTATTAESVYLVTDRVIPGSSELTYDLDIRVKRPCTQGQATCAPDGQTVVFCDDDGFDNFYSCPTTCTSGRCDQGIGETCFDPIEVNMSGTYSPPPGVLGDDVDYGLGIFGGCHADNDEEIGRDAVFAVPLSAGDVLEVFPPLAQTKVFLMKDCLDRDSCINPWIGYFGYRASQDETIYVVVETGWLYFNSITIQITPGLLCAPGWSCVTATKTALCDRGTSYDRELECAGGCDNGLCPANETLSDSCGTAPDVSTGTRIMSSFDRLTNQIDMKQASCGVGEMPGPEHVSSVFANEGDTILVASEHLSGERMAAYIFTDCADPAGSCVAGRELITSMDADSIQYVAESTGQYYVALDSPLPDADEPFGLSIEVVPRVEECTPGTQTCLDNSTLQYCTSGAKLATHNCSGGCIGTTCTTPDGDSCREPIVATAGSYTGDFAGSNNYEAGESAGGCIVGQTTSGADTFYAIALLAGQTLTADLQTTNSDAYLFLSSDCDDRRSCIVNSPATGPTALTYRAEQNEQIYVIVDSASSAPGATYTLDLSVTSGLACAPDSRSCDNGDARICNSSGTAFTSETCPNGCHAGFCVARPETDTCSTAPDAGAGLSVVGQLGSYSNDSPFGHGQCFGRSTDGNDVYYSVTVAQNDVISARVTGEGKYVYILSECDALNCVAGGKEATYRAPRAGTYYVAVDSTLADTNGLFLLEIDVSPAACQQGQTQCNSDGVTLEYCDEFGSFASHTCSSTCSAQACDAPTGDNCLEPIAIAASGPVTGDFSGTNTFDNSGAQTRDAGACFLPDSNSGGDTFYQVDLAAGETLHADLTTNISNAYLIILERCTDRETCLSSNPLAGDTALTYRAESAESVVIVVDSRNTAAGTFTLDITVTPGLTCAPDSWVCDQGDAKLCNPAGTGFDKVFDCASGCTNGFCDYDERGANTCGSAPIITTGTRVRGNFGLLENDVQIGDASCVGPNSTQTDEFLAVQATAGDVIRATVESLVEDSVAVYFFDDCASAEASCFKGNYAFAAPHVATAELLVPTTGTYYAAADGDSGGPFVFTVDVSSGACALDETQCNGSTLQYCEGAGFVDYPCSSTCTTGACDAPTGDICYDAIAVASTGTYSGSYSGKTNALNPANGSCRLTAAQRPDGPDSVYAVTLAANDYLEADLTTAASGASLYLLDGCSYPTQSCREFSTGTNLEFFAKSAGTYYLIVDSTDMETAGFALDLTTTPLLCNPGERTCEPSTGTVTECASDGLSVANTVCPQGCDSRGCTGPPAPNDTCTSAYTVTAPVTLHDSYDRFSNTLDPGVSACLNEAADGPEAIYAVNLNAGDRVEAALASSDNRESIYLVTDCADPRGTCEGGERTDGSAHSLSYTSPISQTVYVVVDSIENITFNFAVSIDFGPPECLPGQTQCADPTTLRYCDFDGFFEDYTCSGGCANGVCGSPQGQACADAITVTDGTSTSSLLNGSSTIDFGQPSGICSSSFGDGDDNFYAIDLVAGDSLTVTAQTPGTSGFDAVAWGRFFVMEDCFDTNTCVDSTSLTGTSRSLTFVAPTTQRYYVVVDSVSSPATDVGYTISFDVQ